MSSLPDGFGAAWNNFPDWPHRCLDREVLENILPACLDAPLRGIFRSDGSAVILKEEIEKRLIVYGTLAPGEENAAQLDGIEGRWRRVFVPGRIDRAGRYPFFYPGRDLESALLFESDHLPGRLPALDQFEGPDYRRIGWPALDPAEGWLMAQIYAARISLE